MSVKDLINAIASGSAVETEQTFNQVMAEKISARLDDMRIEVAQNMFKEHVGEIEEELSLEDYSTEEIEEFMQTEDYEQLDELSKKTLGNYVKKSTKSLSHSSGVSKSSISPDGRKFHSDITSKRKSGISKAVDKLTK